MTWLPPSALYVSSLYYFVSQVFPWLRHSQALVIHNFWAFALWLFITGIRQINKNPSKLVSCLHDSLLTKKAVRPASNWYPQTLPMQLARSRHPFNTRKVPLNAASFLTWHGSWISVVKDPNVNTTYTGLLHKYQPSAEHHPCYSGLQVQGAATTPAARYFNYTCYICLLSRCEALNWIAISSWK